MPEEPVVSSKSGHLFEKRLVIKAIEVGCEMCSLMPAHHHTAHQDTGKCPVTGELLAETDLLAVKGNKVCDFNTVITSLSPALP